MANNERTRAAAEAALATYSAQPGMADGAEAVVDLMADLAHVADVAGFGGGQLLDRAAEHYADELAEGGVGASE
jgi:hypothetical protein